MTLAGCSAPTSFGDVVPSITVEVVAPPGPKTRYDLALASRCFAIQSPTTELYGALDGGSYTLTAESLDAANAVYATPTGLGTYMFLGGDNTLAAATGSPIPAYTVGSVAEPADAAEWTVYNDLAETYFVIVNNTADQALTADSEGNLTFTAFDSTADDLGVLQDESVIPDGQRFNFVPATTCAIFPDLSPNVDGETFSGTRSDGTVAGFADAHVHWSATDFLGGAEHGWPFHKFGVKHAVGDCAETHGPQGAEDAVGAAYIGDQDGHNTDGYPTFSEWPLPGALTHEGMYYKWVERAWKSGLRIMVNDLVENRVLCELVAANDPNQSPVCNEMESVHRQVDFMNDMQDYIDAQYGGPGKGWMRIVDNPADARAAIAAGKMAVVEGIEISHLFNCQINYAAQSNPLNCAEEAPNPGEPENEACEAGHAYGQDDIDDRQEEQGGGGLNPELLCTEAGVDAQLQAVFDKGIRQLFPIHEFDNAFGGNGIFNGGILNFGNNRDTGRSWATYDCPENGEGDSYFYGAGAIMDPAFASGSIYPADKKQCNARWTTPIGEHLYESLMSKGVIIEVDHLELEMKTQLIDKAALIDPPYPLVSTHGGHGGITNQQATDMLAGGGIIYPYKPSGSGYVGFLDKVEAVMPDGYPYPFGVGYGADTNGLGGQAGPQSQKIEYPFTMFQGTDWNGIFGPGITVSPLTFEVSTVAESGKVFDINVGGQYHYGLVADFVEQVRVGGGNDALKALFNSAETYLQMWERTLESRDAFNSSLN
jgi:hypothetical protein